MKYWEKAIEETNSEKMLTYSKKVSKHVLKEIGGLKVDGRRIKTSIEK